MAQSIAAQKVLCPDEYREVMERRDECPLSGVKRTLAGFGEMSDSDPKANIRDGILLSRTMRSLL
jgi:hypothetical protein